MENNEQYTTKQPSEGNSLPGGWIITRVKYISELLRGISYQKEQASNLYKEDYLPILRANNINGDLNFEDLVYVPIRLVKNEQFVKKGDLIFAMSSGSKHLVGKSAIAKQDFNGSYGAFCALLRVSKVIIDSYIAFYFQGSEYRKLISEIAKGTNINNLKRDHILELQIPLPPVPEQRAIVTKIEQLFSELDNGIASLKKAQEQLKVYRQAVLKWAFEGKLTEKWREENKDILETAEEFLRKIEDERRRRYEQELADYKAGKINTKPKPPKELPPLTEKELAKLPQLPEGWGWVRVGVVSDQIFDGPFGSNLKSSDYVDSGIRVIRLENIGNLVFRNELKSFVPEEKYLSIRKHTVYSGDIIFSSFISDDIRVVVLPSYIDKAINKADCFCVRTNSKIINNNFLAYFFSTKTTFSQLETEVHGATRPRINTTQLKNCLIPYCSPGEQHAIVQEIEIRLSVIDKLEQIISDNLQKAEALRQSILKKAFAGKLLSAKELEAVRKDPEWEPAEKLIERIKAEKQHLGKGRKP